MHRGGKYLRAAKIGRAIMDADITGPSIPKAFGLNAERAQSGGTAESGFLYSVKSKTGIQMMSILLLPGTYSK